MISCIKSPIWFLIGIALVVLGLFSCTHTPNINNYTLPELVKEIRTYCMDTLGLKSADSIVTCAQQYLNDYCKLYSESDACKELR